MSLKVKFKAEIKVPRWEYCNEQKDSQCKDGDNYCLLMKGNNDKRYCNLFDETLYSSYGWVKKCDKCVAASINNKDIELL